MSSVGARLRGIVKRFGATTALDGADLELRAGEVHVVLGENGAGKTTLLGVLAGMLRPDRGIVEIAEHTVALKGPREAWSLGVGMVHQHFALVPRLTVLENLALGLERARGRLRLRYEAVRASAGALAARVGLAVPLEAPVETLGVGDRQRVEILKALLREPDVLVLDEPTAVLTPGEVQTLFALLRDLAAQGRTVALVAHKLDEALAVADRVTVLRDGRTALTAPRSEVDAPTLVRAMVGSGAVDLVALGAAPETPVDRPEAGAGDLVAVLDGVHARGRRGEWALDGASLSVRRGEIVGVAGVEGNGQRELARVLAGLFRPEEGHVVLPEAIGLVPQDRATEGVIGEFDLTENFALAHLRPGAESSGWTVPWASLRRRTAELLRQYAIRAPGPDVRARTLSGGNQQRLVVARALEAAGDLLVLENPTRGLDVAASAFVHGRLRELLGARQPPGIVLISTDLDEVLALATRVLVMVRGRLVEVREAERTRAAVGALMLAGDHAAA